MRRSRETFELAWEQEWLIVAFAQCDKLEQAVPEPRRYEDKGEYEAYTANTCSNKSGTAAGLSSLRRWQACFFVPEQSSVTIQFQIPINESEEHEHDEHDFYG